MTIQRRTTRSSERDTGHGTRKTWKPMTPREQGSCPITSYGATALASKQTRLPMRLDLMSNKDMFKDGVIEAILKRGEVFRSLRRPPVGEPPSVFLSRIQGISQPLCPQASSKLSVHASSSMKEQSYQSSVGPALVYPSVSLPPRHEGVSQHMASSPALSIPQTKKLA